MTKEQFNDLSPEEKKVLVAKDVIASVRSKFYLPNIGSYIILPEDLQQSKEDIKSNIDKINGCHVCGIGACILSITKFANELTFEDISRDMSANLGDTDDWISEEDKKYSYQKVEDLLTSVFSAAEICMIENYFEGGFSPYAEGRLQYSDDNDWEWKGIDFVEEHPDDDERLIAIMEKIIAQNEDEIT